MWHLDYAGLLGCMGFCDSSDYLEEFSFVARNTDTEGVHQIVWAQRSRNPRNLHIIVRVQLDAPVKWVDIDMDINSEYLIGAALFSEQPCTTGYSLLVLQ